MTAFPPRTNQEHRHHGEEYSKLKSDSAWESYVREHAARFAELSRLPYFDMVCMIVIDPMHNLLLGTYPIYLLISCL